MGSDKFWQEKICLNCYYLVDVPMSLVGFSKGSGNTGFVIVRLKKLGINARTISVMCIIDHAACLQCQAFFAPG